jgi:hypothetical protein
MPLHILPIGESIGHTVYTNVTDIDQLYPAAAYWPVRFVCSQQKPSSSFYTHIQVGFGIVGARNTRTVLLFNSETGKFKAAMLDQIGTGI